MVRGIWVAVGFGLVFGQRRGHGGDRPVLEAGWRFDVRGELLDDLADLAVFVHDGPAVAAAGEMADELDARCRGQGAERKVEGFGMGQLDLLLSQHCRLLAGWPARLAACLLP